MSRHATACGLFGTTSTPTLKKLDRYTDTLIKTAARSTWLGDLSNCRTKKMSEGPHTSSSYIVTNDRKPNTTILTRSGDDSHLEWFQLSGNKISYCCVCLASPHFFLQFFYATEPPSRLQERENNFREFDQTVTSLQYYCRRRNGTFCGRRVYQRRQFVRDEVNASQTAPKQLGLACVKGSAHSKQRTERKGGQQRSIIISYLV